VLYLKYYNNNEQVRLNSHWHFIDFCLVLAHLFWYDTEVLWAVDFGSLFMDHHHGGAICCGIVVVVIMVIPVFVLGSSW
jgi:hypothetical protein